MPRPSKRIFALIIACILIVTAIVVTHRDKTPIDTTYENENKGLGIAVEGALKKASSEDSDSDGLLNWEESIWKTDANSADTDSDGTNDGAEVDSGRDPTKKGPNDMVQKEKPVTASSTPLTSTDVLSREIFAQYVKARQAGNTAASSDQFVQALIEKELEDRKPTFYTKANIKTITANDDVAVKKYLNDLGEALYLPNISRDETEIDIYAEAVKTKNEVVLKKLDPIITGYKAVLAKLLQVSVPSSLAENHLKLVTNYQLILASVQGFKEVFSDPIVGIVSVTQYTGASDSLSDVFFDIKSLVEDRNIVFEQSEYGYILTTGI